MKWCITGLIINLFSPYKLLVIFIFKFYMYMFIEDIKLLDFEFGINFTSEKFWIFFLRMNFFNKSCAKIEREKR